MPLNDLERAETNLNPAEFSSGINCHKNKKPCLNESQNSANVPFCFLNVYKPKGITSFDVVYKLRKRFGIKKIGHSGTLDPLADGVMQVAIGRATRLLDYLPSDKAYRAKIRFGFFSTTGDAEGEIIPVNSPKFTEADLAAALKSMTGEIEQTPPIYSAIKIGGKKLCDLARKNLKNRPLDVKIPTRIVKIYEANLISFSQNAQCLENFTNINKSLQTSSGIMECEIEISCSKGTYIRTFAEDLAKKLNTGAYLTSLTRTKAGEFSIENSVKIEDANLLNDGILPHLALQNEIYMLTEEEYKLVLNGVGFFPEGKNPKENAPLSLVFENNLVSIGVLSHNKIVCKKVFK